jgi:hypothetical protein
MVGSRKIGSARGSELGMHRWVAVIVSVLALGVVVVSPAQGGPGRDRTFVLAD